MEPVSIKAYSCPRCKEVYKTKRKTTSCIKKHLKSDKVVAARKKLEKEASEIKDKIRLSVDSFYHVSHALEEQARQLGYNLTCDISGSVRLKTTSHCSPINSAKRYKWGSNDPNIEKHNERYGKSLAFCGRIEGTFSRGRSPVKPAAGAGRTPQYFGDWLKAFTSGINTGTGGGGNRFGYDLALYVEDFPKILNKDYKDVLPLDKAYEEFVSLKEDNDKWIAEHRALTQEYEKEYLKWKRFSDPAWAVYNQEIKDVNEELGKLSFRKKEFVNKQRARGMELDDERVERTTPIVNKDFDKNRYNRLWGVFGGR